MSFTTPSSLSPIRRPLLVAGVLALAAVSSAAARELEVTVSPGAPTWAEPIVVTVRGTVTTACGPEIVRLHNPRISPGAILEVDLVEDPCGLPTLPSAHPFEVSATFPRQTPGSYTVRVRDIEDIDSTSVPLAVFEVGGLQLSLPQAARSDAPVSLGVSGWGPCPGLDSLEVVGRVIEAQVSAECLVLPPPPTVFDLDLDLGLLPPGEYEVQLIDLATRVGSPFWRGMVRGSFRVWDAAGCVPSETELCFHGGRFRVTATWRAFDDSTGAGHAVPLAGNETSGLMWFFTPDNTELTLKVLEGCTTNGSWWVFLSSSTTVEFEVVVTDTATGAEQRYTNELGEAAPLRADTAAFPCQ